MTRKKSLLLLSIIVIFGAVTRAIGVFNWQGLLFDEIASVSIAMEPMNRIWNTLRIEMNPPLHFLYLKAWIQMFGSSDVMVRLSSVIIGIGNILIMYALGTNINKSRSGGLWAALITTLAAIPAFLSIIARMYGMLFFFTATTTLFLMKAIEKTRPDKKTVFLWTAYGISLTLALYTHLTAMALPLVYLIYVAYIDRKNNQNHMKPFLISTGLAGALYLPWFLNFVTTRLSRLGGNAWYIYSQPKDLFFLTTPNRFLIEGMSAQFLSTGVFVFFAIIIFVGFFKIRAKNSDSLTLESRIKPPHIMGLLLLYLPMVILFALQLNPLRYYTISIVGLIMLISIGFQSVSRDIISRKTLIALTVSLLIVPSFEITQMTQVAWPDIAKFIENNEQPGDRVITGFSNDLLATRHYYKGNASFEAFAPSGTPQRDEFESDLEFVIRTNANVYVSKENIHEFGNLIGDSKRVFFVFDSKLFGDAHKYYVDWFDENGWEITKSLNTETFTKINVWLMEKPE